ncbi:hypothetical protein BU16DRAFT_71796 [Lophium mytilinum]|uniref:Uncharacterized protein n=1 Tax=Lophium mytilinum TaxID=390894 RepID=A0A6A6QLY1_9PEZI|nr:hypothetical protein BU16DRAFT_71796 [Lophium mytilinum]
MEPSNPPMQIYDFSKPSTSIRSSPAPSSTQPTSHVTPSTQRSSDQLISLLLRRPSIRHPTPTAGHPIQHASTNAPSRSPTKKPSPSKSGNPRAHMYPIRNVTLNSACVRKRAPLIQALPHTIPPLTPHNACSRYARDEKRAQASKQSNHPNEP